MILTRTPLRVSFIGGGSDFPDFFNFKSGYSLGTAVNLFVYTGVLAHSALAENKFKISYRINESVNAVSEIEHPLVRASLTALNWEDPGLHISTLADVPARTGLGSSSAFAVGLWRALNLARGSSLSDYDVARAAIHLEREMLNEPGGWQDQCFSAYGGMNLFKFQNFNFEIVQEFTSESLIFELNQRMVLVSTGAARDSVTHAEITKNKLSDKSGFQYAEEMARLALEVGERIKAASDTHKAITELAQGINAGWDFKSKLNGVASEEVQTLISRGKNAGAVAAKLCGAGGSGFVFFLLGDVSRDKFLRLFPNNRIQSIEVFRKSDLGADLGLSI